MTDEHETETTADGEAATEQAPEAPVGDSATADGEAGEIEALRQEIQTLNDEVLRARAEADNVRKRAEKDVESAHKFGLERMLQALLPVKDSMDMGLDAAGTATDIDAIREGMALTGKMFDDFFEKLSLKTVDPAGERFDPEFHQAMTTEVSTEFDPGTVVRVMQKGYLLNDRLLRPALVVVAKADDA